MYYLASVPISAFSDSPKASHLTQREHLAAKALDILPLFFEGVELTSWAW